MPASTMVGSPVALRAIRSGICQLSGMALTVLGFYFVSKVGQDALDAKRTENTARAFDTIKETVKAGAGADGVGEAAQDTADAAQDQADVIKGK